MTMKRFREEREIETLAMANCLMLLSRVGRGETGSGRVFACKTCNREFPSFQALGGHRASHKKPRLLTGDLVTPSSPAKPKTHECSICGLEFAIGQALGGHMRRHRREQQGLDLDTSTDGQKQKAVGAAAAVPILKRSMSSSKRVLCLDLNLKPYEIDENDVFEEVKKMSSVPAWLLA